MVAAMFGVTHKTAAYYHSPDVPIADHSPPTAAAP